VANYFYVAKSFDGETKTGNTEALNERELAQSLKSRGLVLIKTVLKEEKKNWLNFSIGGHRVSLTDKIMITKNLGVMFSAGLSLVKSFDILASQARSKELKSALLNIKDRVSKGENFSDTLASYPHIFSDLFVNMVKVGEESGTLDEVFQVLSLQLQKEHELRSKIRNAMAYPMIIVLVMIAVGIVIVTFVLPNLNVFFSSLSVEIPIYTKIVLAVGAFLAKNWYLMIVGPIIFFGGIYLILRTKRGKNAADALFLKIPIISPIIKKNNSAMLIRSLSSLVAASVPLITSLEITAKTMGNHYYKEALNNAVIRVKKGEKLSGALKSYQNIFPVGVIEMIEVGEETGKTSSILKKLADFYEQEAIDAIEKVTTLIEPILIIILGLSVGFFAVSIIEPMYSSLKAISE